MTLGIKLNKCVMCLVYEETMFNYRTWRWQCGHSRNKNYTCFGLYIEDAYTDFFFLFDYSFHRDPLIFNRALHDLENKRTRSSLNGRNLRCKIEAAIC